MVATPERASPQSRWDAAAQAELMDIMRAEMAALISEHDDGYYAHRLERGAVLENYEEAALAHLRDTVEPGGAHVVEVGAGWGPLCVALGALGYRVTAFNGEDIHFAAMRRVVDAAARAFPQVGRNVEIRRGFFPYALARDDLAPGRRDVLVSTNTVNEANRSGQDAILAAALQFDRFIVDVATFAHDRDEPEREWLKGLLAHGFASRGAVWDGRMLDLRSRPETHPWRGPRPPAPDWLFADAPEPLDLAEARPTLAARDGHCWTLRLPAPCAALCDGPEAPERSPFRLIEDDTLLGPPHTLHDEIARLGGGRYSHWGEDLYFSTPDGSDPRTNGRRYRLAASVFGGAPAR